VPGPVITIFGATNYRQLPDIPSGGIFSSALAIDSGLPDFNVNTHARYHVS
jgi:hypothetical protein